MMRYATRIYGRTDGVEYTGALYPTLSAARKGVKLAVFEIGYCTQQRCDWYIHKWMANGYGEIVAGSDIQ